MNNQNSCSWPPLGIASVPIQEWDQTYRPEVAFRNGTIFPELNLPFLGKANMGNADRGNANMNDQRGGCCR